MLHIETYLREQSSSLGNAVATSTICSHIYSAQSHAPFFGPHFVSLNVKYDIGCGEIEQTVIFKLEKSDQLS